MRTFLAILCLWTPLGIGALDIVFLDDGEIMLGDQLEPTPQGLKYLVYGDEVTVPLSRIQKTSSDLMAIAESPLSLVLKDGSVINGTVVDFDGEIGLFLDISFGVLTIPTAAIAELYDPILRKRFSGGGFDWQIGGGAFFPLGPVAESFRPSWTGNLGFSGPLPFLQGLRAGGGLSLYGLSYIPSETTQYFMATLWPEIRYSYLGWRLRPDLLSRITPSVALKVGASYITMSDPNLLPSREATLVPYAALELAGDVEITSQIFIRLFGRSEWVVQKNEQFFDGALGLNFGYNL